MSDGVLSDRPTRGSSGPALPRFAASTKGQTGSLASTLTGAMALYRRIGGDSRNAKTVTEVLLAGLGAAIPASAIPWRDEAASRA